MKFGTDGVRGVANVELTAEFAVRLGRAAARVLGADSREVVIGGDTRQSTRMLMAALSAGFAAEGIDVHLIGVVPTPTVAYAAQRRGSMGAMVSASHNPYRDNGIKLFAVGGTKLPDEVEAAIELELDTMQSPTAAPGQVFVGEAADDVEPYVDHVLAGSDGRHAVPLRVVIDAANGAAAAIAGPLFERLGVDVRVIGDAPDGMNINERCGATSPATVAAAVLEHHADVGIALDGDADRLIAVDHTGAIVDGDHVIAILALDLAARGQLAHDTVVVTTMANLGFHLAMRDAGIEVVTTDVGDRYVLEALLAGGFGLGGEQSGHVIFPERATTGDGMLTAVALLEVVARSGRTLAELASSAMTALPQVLVNVAVAERVPDVATLLAADVARLETGLGGAGRILLRPSGTEPLIRVMVEASTASEADRVAQELAGVVRSRWG